MKKNDVEIVRIPYDSMNIEDGLSEEELKQLEKDFLLDGPPGTIPNWSTQYKKQKEKNKSDK